MHREHDPGDAWANTLLDERTPATKRPRGRASAAPARTGRTWAMAVCVLSLLLGTPIAVQAAGEGEPVEGGARNPSPNQTLSYERETEIIAETAIDSYGTRQSNKGAGGGAIYGCRSTLDVQDVGDPKVSTPCIRANNLNDGKAFDFQVTNGNLGGVIQKSNNIRDFFPNAAPFFTNMGGIALGLNSDRVDNMHAEQIIAEAVKQATTGGGGGDGGGDGGGGGDGATDPNGGGAGDSGTCPEGTTAVGDGCLETAAREAADFETAAATCEGAARRLAPVDMLLAVRGTDEFDLGDGEMSDSLTTPRSVDLNQALEPLLAALTGLIGPVELNPATIAAGYTMVPESGVPGGEPIESPRPFRCWIA